MLFLLVVQGTPLPALLWLAARHLAGAPLTGGARWLLVTSGVLVAIRVLMQLAIARSYVTRGITFWLAPTADPLAALRILISTLRTPKRWRSREYERLEA